MKKFLFFALAIFFFAGCSSDDESVDPIEPEIENPNAVDDTVAGLENEELIIEIAFLLENDFLTEDNARIMETDNVSAEGGKINDNRNGSFTYTPPKDFIGEDSFFYSICVPASDRCASAEVTIEVGDAGDPIAVDDEYETKENTPITIRNYLNNDNLLDGAEVSEIDDEGANATIILDENANIIYTPDDGFSGEDTFTYTICDDDEEPSCDTATITISVIDAGDPTAQDDEYVIEAGAEERIFTELLENDNPIDSARITEIDNANTRGEVVLYGNGTVSYTAPTGYSGEDSFAYWLCDNDTPDATCAKATVTIQLVETIAFNIPAEIADYYEGVAISDNEDLNFKALSELTENKHTTILSYGQRHEYLYDADEDPADSENVILIYSGESRYWEEYTSGNNSYSPQTYNTEHIFPQSRLISDEAVADLHHLRVADAGVNEQRLNNPYADGSGDYELIDDSAWFPGDEWKGDVARMVLYLNLRYNEDISKVGNIELFLKWNREDPVSKFEKQRNDVIENAQGNRNPFIDNPYLITLIWGGEAAENTW